MENITRKNYIVENEEIIFRRARIDDNIEEIAELLYHTDPYIYPFWFNHDLQEAKKFLVERIKEEGFIFNYNNIYIAYDKTTNHIVGILCGLDNSVNLKYDYSTIENINNNYHFTINHYIKEIINEVVDSNHLYISNICVDKNYRGKHIGTRLLGYFIRQMENAGFETFALDCLLHNLRAKNLYHNFGFREIKEIVGFDGTENSKVEVVSMLRKKGEYLPEEFK